MNIVSWVIDFIFEISLFVNAMLFIPQILQLLKQKHSKDVSLLTFGGFCIMQITAIVYGVLKQDMFMIVGYSVSLLTCGIVTFLIVYYRHTNGRR